MHQLRSAPTWEAVGAEKGRLEESAPIAARALPWTWPRRTEPSGCSQRVAGRRRTAGCRGPSEAGHQSCHDDAGDLPGEVTTVCRREDLGEPRCQAPVDFQPAVAPLYRFFYPYAFQGLGRGEVA